jgi:hypothetical protein
MRLRPGGRTVPQGLHQGMTTGTSVRDEKEAKQVPGVAHPEPVPFRYRSSRLSPDLPGALRSLLTWPFRLPHGSGEAFQPQNTRA